MSYYELLNKVVHYLNETIENIDLVGDDMTKLYSTYVQLQDWVNRFFDNLDVQNEISEKLDKLASNGVLTNLLLPHITSTQNPIFVATVEEMTNPNRVYVIQQSGLIYSYNSSTKEFSNTGLVYGVSKDTILGYTRLVDSGNWNSVLPSVNDLHSNSVYRLNFAIGTTADKFPSGLPFNVYPGVPVIVMCFANDTSITSVHTGDYQIVICKEDVYTRFYQQTGWSAWVNKEVPVVKYFIPSFKQLVDVNNWNTVLPNVDNLHENGVYRLNFAGGTPSGSFPSGLPFSVYPNAPMILLSFANDIAVSGVNTGNFQILIHNGVMYTRFYSINSWSKWVGDSDKVYTVGATGDYTSFSECISAVGTTKCKIIVQNGVYDIYAEMKALFGDSYFENYTLASNGAGLLVGGGVEIDFSSNSVLKFHYDGNNTEVLSQFSPLNSSSGGFTVKNMVLETSRCRYPFHDELGHTNARGTNVFERCIFKHDNSNNGSWGAKQCIGGGFGGQTTVVIEDCYFESVGGVELVSYHSRYSGSGKGNLVMKGCYFADNGTFIGKWAGTSTDISVMTLSNNSFGQDIVVRADSESATVNNIEVIEFNNTVR
jgi:hypothetical protein